MTSAKKSPKDYGPHQACARVGLAIWQWERAIRDGLVPRRDPFTGRWPAVVVDAAAADRERIRQAVGEQPDVGAHRAAEILSERLGVEFDPGMMLELDRLGLIGIVGDHKGWPLYDGRALERFDDREALERAAATGRLVTRDQAAGHLRIRESDLQHLVRAGRLAPTDWVLSSWQRRRDRPSVALYRVGDLDELLGAGDIDWDAVRATVPGRRSPLAKLPDATQPH